MLASKHENKILFYKYGNAQYIETHCPWIVSTKKKKRNMVQRIRNCNQASWVLYPIHNSSMQPILDTELQKVCSEGSLQVASLSLPPLHSHAFLGRTNPTGDFRQVFLHFQSKKRNKNRRFLYLYLWITNPFSNIVGRLSPRNGYIK